MGDLDKQGEQGSVAIRFLLTVFSNCCGHIYRVRMHICYSEPQHHSELQTLWRAVGGRQKACLLTRKLLVFLQLPCFVQLCSAAGAQHGYLQPRRDLGQPELKFQKKNEETKRPLTVFKRYIVLLFPAFWFD